MLLRRRHKKTYSDLGQTLVEVVVVIALSVVLITGIIAGTTRALLQSNDSEDTSSEVKYAQEGIEIVRYKRDQGWETFAQMGETQELYCLGADQEFDPVTLDDLCQNNLTDQRFGRSVILEMKEINGVPTMHVEVMVQSITGFVTLTTYLTQK